MIERVNPISATRNREGASPTKEGMPVLPRGPKQVVGLSPLTDCSVSTCRYWNPDCCYKIPVFGELATETPDTDPSQWDSSMNDQSAFLVSFPSYNTGSTNTSTISFRLQKIVNGAWAIQADLSTGTMGTHYPFYSLAIFYYTGTVIQWRKVLNTYGEGCYRILISYGVNAREGCMTSETFLLREFSCALAHGTFRADAKLFDGDIADIDRDGIRASLCGIAWADSIRHYGFFGYETSDEEKRQIELTDGKILKMRDELVQKFELTTGLLPKWAHDRFKAYGTMADELRITDYNWNNSDYLIKYKLVVRDGGYAPNYKIGSRLSWVKVTFKEGWQNVSRSLCCGAVFSGK